VLKSGHHGSLIEVTSFELPSFKMTMKGAAEYLGVIARQDCGG
jgi:hypothetical protein